MRKADLTQEQKLVASMDALCAKVLAPGDERIYWVVVEGPGTFLDLDIRHAGSAYLLWASIGDLMDSPWGPGSEHACNWMARKVAADWLLTDHASYGAIEDFFESWSSQLRTIRWPRSLE